MPTLHTLNALRVIAEFAIVHCHLFPVEGRIATFLTNSLMSFFYVLSGFVAMYSYAPGDAAQYIRRRVVKVYPLYLFWTLCQSVASLGVSAWTGRWPCPAKHVCFALCLFMLNAWDLCEGTADNSGAGWYVATLMWLWLLFPFIHGRIVRHMNGWDAVCGVYALSLLPWLANAYFPGYEWAFRKFAPFRLGEFLMGCGAARLIDRPTSGWAAAAVACALGAHYALEFAVFGVQYPALCSLSRPDTACPTWPSTGHPLTRAAVPCVTVWEAWVLSKTSIAWAWLIHYAASTDGASPWPLRFLHWAIFKSLSQFSLHLYLGHLPIAFVLRAAALEGDLLLFATYACCYACHVLVDPWIDAWLSRPSKAYAAVAPLVP